MRARAERAVRARLPDVIAALLLAGALALSGLAWHRFDQMQQRQATARRDAVALRQAIVALRQNRDDLVAYGPRYHALQAGGGIGVFDKPRALDGFEQAARPFGDQLRDYSLAAQAPAQADVPGASALQHHDLYRHQLSFDARPVHEEAFVAMLSTLQRRTPGTAAIESCELGRAQGAGPAELSAHCTMNWYSFVPRAGGLAASATMPGPTPAGAAMPMATPPMPAPGGRR